MNLILEHKEGVDNPEPYFKISSETSIILIIFINNLRNNVKTQKHSTWLSNPMFTLVEIANNKALPLNTRNSQECLPCTSRIINSNHNQYKRPK